MNYTFWSSVFHRQFISQQVSHKAISCPPTIITFLFNKFNKLSPKCFLSHIEIFLSVTHRFRPLTRRLGRNDPRRVRSLLFICGRRISRGRNFRRGRRLDLTEVSGPSLFCKTPLWLARDRSGEEMQLQFGVCKEYDEFRSYANFAFLLLSTLCTVSPISG